MLFECQGAISTPTTISYQLQLFELCLLKLFSNNSNDAQSPNNTCHSKQCTKSSKTKNLLNCKDQKLAIAIVNTRKISLFHRRTYKYISLTFTVSGKKVISSYNNRLRKGCLSTDMLLIDSRRKRYICIYFIILLII